MVVQQSFIENFISNQSLVTFSYYAIQVMWFFINRLEVAQKKLSNPCSDFMQSRGYNLVCYPESLSCM